MARFRRTSRATGARPRSRICVLAAWLAIAGLPQAPPAAVPPLVVIGIDGFRPDYLERADVPVLRGLAERGVRGAGLIPPFPSKTFPSFTTIATGLWPAHHGIVGNTMDDPAIGRRFTLADLDGRSDPRWWLGEPIWAAVERQGRRASGMFWPGDDVVIGGRRPSDWLRFDDAFPDEARVDRALDWFARPSAERPALAMLYFSLVDEASHEGGPDSPQALAAAAAADRLVGRLVSGLERRGLGSGVNLVVVSDHGMAETRLDRVVVLDDLIDPATVDVLETGPMLRVARRPPSGPSERAILDTLRGGHPRLSVYAAAELPAAFHAGGSPRLPPVLGLADEGWLVLTRAERDRWVARGGRPRGDHGYAPALPSMHGLFVASGPDIRRGPRPAPFDSVHLYALFCRLLRIAPGRHDGDARTTAGLVR